MRGPILISILIHLLFAGLIIGGGNCKSGGDSDQGAKNKTQTNDGEIQDKKSDDKPVEDKSISIDIIQLPKKDESKDKGVTECKDNFWYGGIGIEQNANREIIYIAHGYPAEKAGLKLGDIILSDVEIRGEPGTQVTLDIRRGDEMFNITITRDKVCLIEATPGSP